MFWIPGAQYFGSQEDIEMDTRRTIFWIPGAQCFGSQEDIEMDNRRTIFWIPGDSVLGSRRTLKWIPGGQCFGSQEQSTIVPQRSLNGVGIGIGRSRIFCRDDGTYFYKAIFLSRLKIIS